MNSNRVRKFLFLFSIFFFYTSISQAKCIASPKSGWQIVSSSATLVGSHYYDTLHALQGVQMFEANDKSYIALTHGYTERNASLLTASGKLLKSISLDGTLSAPLVADVVASDNSLWWSDYRTERLYRTSFDLESVETVALPDDIGTLVGLTFVPEINAIIFPTRSAPFHLSIVKTTPDFEIRKIPFKEPLRDPYDIRYYDGCLFLVDRAGGRILTVDASQLASDEAIHTNVFAEGLTWPQHIDIFKDQLLVIETKANQVSKFDFFNGKHSIHQLDDNRIYRGLTVLADGLLGLTGFFDLGDEIKESNTGLFLFRLH